MLDRKGSVVCLEPVRWEPRSGTDRKGRSGIRMIADCRTGAEGPGVLVDVGIGDDFAPPKWSGGTVQRSEEHTSELQSLMSISYAVFCLKNKKHQINTQKYIHQ